MSKSSQTLFEGSLFKRENIEQKWNKKYFVLGTKTLKYYKKSHSSRNAQGEIILDDSTRIGKMATDENQEQKNIFFLRNKRTIIYLSAETVTLLNSWIQYLVKAISSPSKDVSFCFDCPSIKGVEPISLETEKRITQTIVVTGVSSTISLHKLHEFLERNQKEEKNHKEMEKLKENGNENLEKKKRSSDEHERKNLKLDELWFGRKKKNTHKKKKQKHKEKKKETQKENENENENENEKKEENENKILGMKKIFKTRRSAYWAVVECASPEVCVQIKNKVFYNNYYCFSHKSNKTIKHKFSCFYPRCVMESFGKINLEKSKKKFTAFNNSSDVYVIKPNGTVLRSEIEKSKILQIEKVQSLFQIGCCKFFQQFFSKSFVAPEMVYTIIPFNYIPQDLDHFTVIVNRISKGDKVRIKMGTKMNEIDSYHLNSVFDFSKQNEKIAKDLYRVEKEEKLIHSWYDRPTIYHLLKKIHLENYQTSRSCRFLFGLHDFFGNKVDDQFPLQMNEITVQMFNWVNNDSEIF
ncbi:swap-70 recombinase [Anaeramoeba flamelloides]|uniref:Swap-70 recombinase n=1 Tax=Anaeramoeba flamelloides TaxID=1746091 RepID=A0AAV7YRF9_9EUKA|nr:swap-70 recombinase [Anaeramoeba flamelloides]